MRVAIFALVLAGCDATPEVAPPPPKPAIDCFGESCQDTCCLIGDAGVCTADARACAFCIDVPDLDGGDASACLPASNTFECFSSADCLDSAPPPGTLDGPYACCGSGLFGFSTWCSRLGFFGCGLLSTQVCTSQTDCAERGTCKPVVVNGVLLPLRACQ